MSERIFPGDVVNWLRKFKWWLSGGLLFLVAATFAFAHLYVVPMRAEDEAQKEGPEAVAVEVAHVVRGDIQDTAWVTGQTSARASVDLVPMMGGQVKEVYVSMGQRVQQGEPLVRLDDSNITPQVQQAEAAVEMAQAQLDQVRAGARDEEIQQAEAAVKGARAALESAEWTYERMKRLHEKEVISGAQLREAEMQYASAQSQLESAEAQLNLAIAGPQEEAIRAAEAQIREAKAAMQAARNALEDTLLESTIDGRVAYVQVEPGDLVDVGMPTVGIVDIDPIRVEALVTDRIVGLIEQKDQVTVQVPAVDNEFIGTISEIAPTTDPERGMYPVRILIDNPEAGLRPGMTAEVRFVKERAEDVLIIPRESLSVRGDEYYVFAVEDGVARRRSVKLGMQDEDFAEVRSGLDEDDVVVYYGVEYLEDGTPVNIVEERE